MFYGSQYVAAPAYGQSVVVPGTALGPAYSSYEAAPGAGIPGHVSLLPAPVAIQSGYTTVQMPTMVPAMQPSVSTFQQTTSTIPMSPRANTGYYNPSMYGASMVPGMYPNTGYYGNYGSYPGAGAYGVPPMSPRAGYGYPAGAGFPGQQMGMGRSLLIRPVSAQLSRGTDWLGRMDPQVEANVGGQIYRSAVAQGMGKTPSWNDTFTHQLRGNENAIQLTIYDIDKANKNDIVGQTVIPLNDVMMRGASSNWYDLTYNGTPAGRVMVNLQLV